jgi:hypothetical protein
MAGGLVQCSCGVSVHVEPSGRYDTHVSTSLPPSVRYDWHQLEQLSADQIPVNMIGRFLDNGDLRKLHRLLIKKKPPAPSVRRRTAAKRRVGKR